MKRRLFIAVNLDEQARRAIGRIEKDTEDAFTREKEWDIRFMPEENWHVTVSFLGTQDDASLTDAMSAMRAAAKNFSPVNIVFTEIAYAPQKDHPRMIWLRTSRETSAAFGEIKEFLEDRLAESGVRFERESRAFSGHITLARFQNTMAPDGLPKIERTVALHCAGISLDLMESELGRNGATYTVLQRFPFSKNE
jgi:2'-5' RNA ligase